MMQVDSVRNHVVKHIEADWPQTVEEWYRWFADYRRKEALRRLPLPSVDQSVRVEASYPEPAAAIRLAYDFGIHSILPAAFYRLSITSPKSEWVSGPDGIHNPHFLSARWGLLTTDDCKRFVSGCHELADEVPATAQIWTQAGEFVCANDCEEAKRDLQDGQLQGYPGQLRAILDVLFQLLVMVEDIEESRKESVASLCWDCKTRIMKRIGEYMDKVWEDLPQMFMLPAKDATENDT